MPRNPYGWPVPAATSRRQVAQVLAALRAGTIPRPGHGIGVPPARVQARPVPAVRAGGWHGSPPGLAFQRRPPVISVRQYQPVRGVPLQPQNAQALVAGGTATVRLGPAGLGNVWYPTQVTVATTTGVTTGLDTSIANLYLGPLISPATLLAPALFGGNGVIATALPNIQPGQFLIVVWTGAKNGDTAVMNVQGSMDALA